MQPPPQATVVASTNNPENPDRNVLLLLSGPLAVGKTSVADELVSRLGFERVRSGAFLLERAQLQGRPGNRADLQALGDELDESTDYRWLIDDVAVPALSGKPSQKRWLIDAVRKERQVYHFRQAFGQDVVHLHLDTEEGTLRARYEARSAAGTDYLGSTPYEQAIRHPNEVSSRALREVADIVVNVEGKTPREIVAAIATHIGEVS
jgi:adenylosuccinate synthase